MTWKPTEAMETVHVDAYSDEYDKHGFSTLSLQAALIAVQPLIAAEAMERAAQIADAFVASTEDGPLDRVDTFQNMAADSIAHAIRFASTGNITPPPPANRVVAAMIERAMAEARAKALEDAAKVAENDAPDWHERTGNPCNRIAKAIRSLVPKPVEGA